MNDKPEIKAVFFDLGKVLLDFDWNPILLHLNENGATTNPDEFMNYIVRRSKIKEYERGEVNSQEFLNELLEHLNYKKPFNDFLPVWNDIFTLLEENIKTFYDVKERLPVALISNINESHLEWVEDNYQFLQDIPVKYYSCDVGSRKPEDEIFNRALSEFDVKAENAIFIDDMQENIEAARLLGIHSLHLTPDTDLRSGLKELGLDYL